MEKCLRPSRKAVLYLWLGGMIVDVFSFVPKQFMLFIPSMTFINSLFYLLLFNLALGFYIWMDELFAAFSCSVLLCHMTSITGKSFGRLVDKEHKLNPLKKRASRFRTRTI